MCVLFFFSLDIHSTGRYAPFREKAGKQKWKYFDLTGNIFSLLRNIINFSIIKLLKLPSVRNLLIFCYNYYDVCLAIKLNSAN